MPYRFTQDIKDHDKFHLYNDDNGLVYLGSFRLLTMRKDLEEIAASKGFTSKWIGAMLRLFYKYFPDQDPLKRLDLYPELRPYTLPLDDPERYDESFLVDYLRQKGYIVYRPIPVPDEKIIKYLEKIGYVVERIPLRNIFNLLILKNKSKRK